MRMPSAGSDVEVALAAATAGAAVVRAAYGAVHVRHAKGGADFATEADLDAERAILGVIEAARPGDARIGEESGEAGGSGTRRWLVDPLCGTLNFAAETPLLAVNVALVDGTSSIAAVSADPITRELFWADGGGAYLRHEGSDVPLRPSAESRLVDVNCDGPADRPFVGPQLVAAFVALPLLLNMLAFAAWFFAVRRWAKRSPDDSGAPSVRGEWILHAALMVAITAAAVAAPGRVVDSVKARRVVLPRSEFTLAELAEPTGGA